MTLVFTKCGLVSLKWLTSIGPTKIKQQVAPHPTPTPTNYMFPQCLPKMGIHNHRLVIVWGIYVGYHVCPPMST